MRTNFLTGLILATGIFFVFLNHSNGQVLQVTSGITPEEMVEMLIGVGVDYDNVVFMGADSSRGSFSGGPGNIGLSTGIILTSGHVDLAPGPNTMSGAGSANMTPGDADLEALSGAGSPSYDACVLEFDFVPYYSYVWFRFVFASEEYPEFVGTAFNDVFGFFISGPGITGPFTNNGKNIALIPGTETAVSINNVNQAVNAQYFVSNDTNFVQYDGFTTVLVAESEVVPMETYHIKLAVTDIADQIFDSGVFLEASSFCSSPVSISERNHPQANGEHYRVYPVPSGDVLSISSLDGRSMDIQLTGLDGRSYITCSGESNYSLAISSLPSGIYFLRITGNDGVMTKKIYKK
jgi:hypothetical protein